MKKSILIITVISVISLLSCSKDKIKGCTDAKATNFDSLAEEDDGSCQYTGRVTFYTTKCDAVNGSGEKITIYVGGGYFWDISNCFPVAGCSDACSCSAGVSSFPGGVSSYYSNSYQKFGTYNYTAYDIDSTNTWSGSYTINSTNGVCIGLN